MTPRTVSAGRRRTTRTDGGRFKRWLGIVVVVVILFFIAVNQHGLFRLWRLQTEHEQLQAEIVLLRERAQQLRQGQAQLENDMRYIEKLAREKYRMVKRGEKVFRVIPSSEQQPAGEQEQTP
ncbi:MAG: septum formation initiator family protein [Candidatus Neomarinimicrobiota bacterium]